MHMSTRARGSLLQWLIAAGLVAFIVLAPSVVASLVSQQQGTSIQFVQRPWVGWTFAGNVLTASTGSPTASPGSALERATNEFVRKPQGASGASFSPTAVELVYLPGHHKLTFQATPGTSPVT